MTHPRKELVTRLLMGRCELCEQTGHMHVHHVGKLADLQPPETTGEIIDTVPAPITVVSDNGACFRGETYQAAFVGEDLLLRHVRTRVRSPQSNGLIERFFGTLTYEHLYRAPIDDGDALAMEPPVPSDLQHDQTASGLRRRDASERISGR